MSINPDGSESPPDEYENVSEPPFEVRDPLEDPLGDRGHQVLGQDATVAEEDARELPPEEHSDQLRAADTDLTVEDEPV